MAATVGTTGHWMAEGLERRVRAANATATANADAVARNGRARIVRRLTGRRLTEVAFAWKTS